MQVLEVPTSSSSDPRLAGLQDLYQLQGTGSATQQLSLLHHQQSSRHSLRGQLARDLGPPQLLTASCIKSRRYTPSRHWHHLQLKRLISLAHMQLQPSPSLLAKAPHSSSCTAICPVPCSTPAHYCCHPPREKALLHRPQKQPTCSHTELALPAVATVMTVYRSGTSTTTTRRQQLERWGSS
jgi:hypothetical protein